MAAGKSNLDVLGVGSGQGAQCVQNWEGWRENIDSCRNHMNQSLLVHAARISSGPMMSLGWSMGLAGSSSETPPPAPRVCPQSRHAMLASTSQNLLRQLCLLEELLWFGTS